MNTDTLQNKNRPIRVLLVEDNGGDVMLIQRAFQQISIPHEITVAYTGEEALRVINGASSDNQSDMILLDLNLPGLSGHEVLINIKQHEEHKKIPVCILSSSRAMEDVMGSYNAYANCYIVKPYDLDSLCDIANRIEEFWFSVAVLPDNNGSPSL